MKVATPSILFMRNTLLKILLALTVCLTSCKTVVLSDLQENEEVFRTRKIYNSKFEFISIRKSKKSNVLREKTDISKYQLIFANLNERVEIRFLVKDKSYARLHNNFTEKAFSTIIPNYFPFDNHFKVDLFFLENNNYFLKDEVDVHEGRIKLFFNISDSETKNEIGNRLMRAVSIAYHELLHVDSAMKSLTMPLVDEEVKASTVELCSLFYMPSFSKLTLNKDNFTKQHYSYLNKNLESSKDGFNLALGKILKITNKKVITQKDLIDNKKIKALCNDL